MRKTGSATTYFAYDEQGKLLGNYDSSNRPQQETIYLGDTPVAVMTGDGNLVDNSASASVIVTGAWPTATAGSGYQGANYQTHAAGGLDSFAWKGPASAGSYRVYVRYPAATDRATDAPYTVTHTSGVANVQINQRVNGGQWVSLGSYSFPANAANAVKLTTSPSGVVAADAVKFLPVNPAISYIHADHLNTPRAITSTATTANNVLWRWDSDPFGVGFPNEDVGGNGVKFTYNLRFSGQYYDAETNNFYNYFRDYDPSLGRYVQSDPVGLEGGINTYTYGRANPVGKIDPFGLQVGVVPGVGPGAYAPPVGSSPYYSTPGSGTDDGDSSRDRPTHDIPEERPTHPDLVSSDSPSGSESQPAQTSADECGKPKCQEGCDPCRTISGKIVAVGTIGYRPLDVIPDTEMQHGVYGSHHNIFKANQYPYPKCDCFWAKQKWVAKPDQLHFRLDPN